MSKAGPLERRRLEQLRFRLTGRWSDKVVAERLRSLKERKR